MNAPPVINASSSPPNPRCTLESNMRLSFTFGRRRVRTRLTAIWALRSAAFQVLYNHGNQRYIGDAITHKCIAHELRTQRAQMHHTSSAYERSDKTHHEVDRVIGRKNAQIPHARPKGIPRRQRATLFQIVLVGENASLRPAARAR